LEVLNELTRRLRVGPHIPHDLIPGEKHGSFTTVYPEDAVILRSEKNFGKGPNPVAKLFQEGEGVFPSVALNGDGHGF